MAEPMLIAKNLETSSFLLPKMANRHGMIAGATGTGKTVTLQTLAEGFSKIGVPVFMADVKGDLSGMSQPAGENKKVKERIELLDLDWFKAKSSPVTFWDAFGEKGHPIRTTVSEMGPLLLARMLDLNKVQTGVLNAIFKIADDEGWLL
ncbi:MAG: ATP-binding protein, partial [Methylophilaceae bacterium]